MGCRGGGVRRGEDRKRHTGARGGTRGHTGAHGGTRGCVSQRDAGKCASQGSGGQSTGGQPSWTLRAAGHNLDTCSDMPAAYMSHGPSAMGHGPCQRASAGVNTHLLNKTACYVQPAACYMYMKVYEKTPAHLRHLSPMTRRNPRQLSSPTCQLANMPVGAHGGAHAPNYCLTAPSERSPAESLSKGLFVVYFFLTANCVNYSATPVFTVYLFTYW